MPGLKIGDLAEHTGTSTPTIRYYEEIGLLPRPDRQDGDRLRFGPIVTTLMACADTALAAQEREFLGMLELVDRSVVAGDEVTLYDGDRVVARFTAGRPQ